ncbi:MAG: hypothetical protein CMK59_01195 [Proteobacteria bacterium]|nr:hypothetical protein [Pseudomonadota bacterium]
MQNGQYPEDFLLLSGEDIDSQGEVYGWAQGRGYLYATPEKVWQSIRVPDVYINHGEVTSYEVEEMSSVDYDYLYIVWNYVENIMTIEFENEWRHGLILGDKDKPEHIAIRWEKVSGTDFILSLNGSIQIYDRGFLDDGTPVCEIQVIEHLQSTLDPEENALNYIDRLWPRWKAAVHDEEIPHQ